MIRDWAVYVLPIDTRGSGRRMHKGMLRAIAEGRAKDLAPLLKTHVDDINEIANHVRWFSKNLSSPPEPLTQRANPELLVHQERQTLLHLAALSGHRSVIDVLLKAGGDPQARDSHGRTPLHLAALSGHIPAVEALLRKSNVAAVDKEGARPLHLAAMSGVPKLIKLLLAAGATPTSKAFDGRTAMHYAAQAGQREAVLALWEGGVKFDQTDSLKNTALDYAIAGGHQELVDLLSREAFKDVKAAVSEEHRIAAAEHSASASAAGEKRRLLSTLMRQWRWWLMHSSKRKRSYSLMHHL
eukprot:m.830327 g.830327  ORF g.830327 m.830327 type:complete len:298 (+) comp59453_c0_seq8:267-1160(+)